MDYPSIRHMRKRDRVGDIAVARVRATRLAPKAGQTNLRSGSCALRQYEGSEVGPAASRWRRPDVAKASSG